MSIQADDIRTNADKVIQKAERIERLTKMEGWNDFMEVLDTILRQEIAALAGIELGNGYYKKIGFLQETAFIKAIPDLIKDAKVRDYLLHQGRAKAIETIRNIPFLYQKQKRMALDQLQQVLGSTDLNKLRTDTANEAYRNS